MDPGGAFLLGLVLLIFWAAVIVMFSRPNLFRDMFKEFVCCLQQQPISDQPTTPHKLTITPGHAPSPDYYPTHYTVPSSRSSSMRRSRRSHSARSTSKSPSRRSSQQQAPQLNGLSHPTPNLPPQAPSSPFTVVYADDLTQRLAMEIAITSAHNHNQNTSLLSVSQPVHVNELILQTTQSAYDPLHKQRLATLSSQEREILIPLPEEDSELDQSQQTSRRQSEENVLINNNNNNVCKEHLNRITAHAQINSEIR